MAIQIPKNRILKQNNYGDTSLDIVESFNLDLSSNLGAIKLTPHLRGRSVGDTGLKTVVSIDFYRDRYWALTDDVVFYSGVNPSAPSNGFTLDNTVNAPSTVLYEYSSLKVFNDKLYVVEGQGFRVLSGGTWSNPITTGLVSNSMHLLTVFGDKLYVTNIASNSQRIYNVNTSDVLSTTGTGTIDVGTVGIATFLDKSQNSIWAGYCDFGTGKGLVIQWDGETENLATQRIELESGVLAGCILDNVPYILNTQGRIMAYNGSSFVEVERLFKKSPFSFYNQSSSGADSFERLIHPNGMVVTDEGTILMLIKNTNKDSGSYENTIPSGIYEYDPKIGLYHKYSITNNTNGDEDYGQQRLLEVGGLFFRRIVSTQGSAQGIIVAGARVFTDATSSTYGIWYDQTLNTVQKWGYFITSKLLSAGASDTWMKIYAIYKKLLNNTDKIVVKYRTVEATPTQATITWTNSNAFTTTTNVSGYSVGDEVQVVNGKGAGKSAHILSITVASGTYTVTLDDNFSNVSGTAIALFDKWIKIGEVLSTDEQQQKALTLRDKNTSPWIQFKVCMQFTGENELYKLRIINDTLIKE
jgi:hypothetical protein